MMPRSAQAQAQKAADGKTYEFMVRDLVYQRNADKTRLARLYRPSGGGAVPGGAAGAWRRLDQQGPHRQRLYGEARLPKAASSSPSIDFRMPPVAPHPGSIQDINLGIRWLKANAREFKSRPEWVGSWGTSSGGHQVLLAAILAALSPTYSALPRPGRGARCKAGLGHLGLGRARPARALQPRQSREPAGPDRQSRHVLRQRGRPARGDAGAHYRKRREGLPAARPGVPGHQERIGAR